MAAYTPEPPRFDPIAQFKNGLRVGPPWESIVDFATHKSFCNYPLYPRQLTLLKLIYLETEQMTQYDRDVIEGWREGFKNRASPMGVQPDIWDRIAYLQASGYTHFTHILPVMGRRASKGILGSILAAERIAFLVALHNWQATFQQPPGQVAEVMVVATSQGQAVDRQFKDIRNTVMKCEYLNRYIVGNTSTEFQIQTPGDLDRISDLQRQGVPIDPETATIHCKAVSAVSTSGRGGTGLMNLYDEFAHLISGTGSTKTSEQIYDAFQPSLDQFGSVAMTYAQSSPYCMEESTRVLTEDLRWVPVGDLAVGDRLIGFDENDAGGRGYGRTWQPAEVTRTSIIQAPRYRVTTESGKRITCTGEHLWLTKRGAGVGRGKGRGLRSRSYPQHLCWIKTEDLRFGDTIKSLGVDPWDEDNSRDAGYLAGFLDGEGHLCAGTLGLTQNRGLVLNKVTALLKERGFDMSDYAPEAPLAKMRVRGGWPEILRLLGTVRPERLLDKLGDKFYGGRIYGNKKAGPSADSVVSVERVEDGPVVALATSTHTLIAEGLLSHNTQIGKFYDLYKEGCVTMDVYNRREGRMETRSFAERAQGQDLNADEDLMNALVAEPTMLVVQLPSWEPYRDWDISRTIPMRPNRSRHFPSWEKPVQWEPKEDGRSDERVQFRRKQRNPEQFKVERGAQFAAVEDAYLNEVKVDQMFLPPGWRDELVPMHRGKLSIAYRAHADPSRTNANFAFCIGHLEDAPEDQYGMVWPHVIIDVLRVWKPENFPEHTIDYVFIQEELDKTLTMFPSIKKMTYDQFNSAGFIAHQRRKFPTVRVAEQTFTLKENQDRFEKFKSALNLGWVHSWRDSFGEDGQSLLELELKFLQEKNGKVDKPEIGPVQTKDLADAVMVVTVDLLHESLDRWYKSLNRTAVGSTYTAGLRSGRESERLAMFETRKESPVPVGAGGAYNDPLQQYFAQEAMRAQRRSERAERNKNTLENNKLERGRRNAFGGRNPYTPSRTRGGREQ